jgi:hypothetical protein
MGRRFAALVPTSYEVRCRDGDGHVLLTQTLPAAAGNDVDVAVPLALARQANGYLRVEVRALWPDASAPSPAQFHLRLSGKDDLRLVGVVH